MVEHDDGGKMKKRVKVIVRQYMVAWLPQEADAVMLAVGHYINERNNGKHVPIGRVIAAICREWMRGQ